MNFRADIFIKKLIQFIPKASLCKSTFLSFDSKNKNRIKAISLSKITKDSKAIRRGKNKNYSEAKNRVKAISKVGKNE